MSEKKPKDSHYARLRRQFRDNKAGVTAKRRPIFSSHSAEKVPHDRVRLYGIHTVDAALKNPKRKIFRMLATQNALSRLLFDESKFNASFPVEVVTPKAIETILGSEAVHQGVMIESSPLKSRTLANLGEQSLIIVLDQVTDPHNVGAIMRSAVAFNADSLITTSRHSPQESGVLAKSASGALEFIEHITVRNLSEALVELSRAGFKTFGLDSEGAQPLEDSFNAEKIALVLGAEGKGLRQKTRETVDTLARLDMPGNIKSLNVSNAAAIALYAARLHLK